MINSEVADFLLCHPDLWRHRWNT